MSLWQFRAATLGVHRANTPEDSEQIQAPGVADFEAALANTVLH